MSMPRLLRHRDALRLLAAIVLLGWVLRALVLSGFMPAAGSTHSGLPGLVICSQGMPQGGAPGPGLPQPDALAAIHCVLGSQFSQFALPGPSGAMLLALAVWLVVRGQRSITRVRASRSSGPPVGSRAPPSLSAFSLLYRA